MSPRNFRILAFVVLCAYAASASAQAAPPTATQGPAKTFYAELLGPGLASINFDIRFSQRQDGWGGRVGFGYFQAGDGSVALFPVGINTLLGKDGRHYFEVGGGTTIVTAHGDYGGNFSSTFEHLWFGYRMQPAEGGFTFRAGINPIFGHGVFIPYYFGLSLGYKW